MTGLRGARRGGIAAGRRIGGSSGGPVPVTTAFDALGAYRGGSLDSRVVQFEAAIGRSITGQILDFTGGSGSGGTAWTTRRSQINTLLTEWVPRCVTAGTNVLHLTLRPWPTSLAGQLAAAAAGDFDAHYVGDAESLEAAGFDETNVIVRLMHEFNGNFYPHSIDPNATGDNLNSTSLATNQANHIAAWHNMVDAMRSVIPGLRFCWCPLRQTMTAEELEGAYPGDAYVDVLGLDAYNWRNGTDNLNDRWDLTVNGPSGKIGQQWHRDFSRARNKPVSYPEWGLVNRGVNGNIGGDDDGVYMANQLDWIDEDGAAGYLDPGGNMPFEHDATSGNNTHQLYDYSGDAANYDFADGLAEFDARMAV